MPSDAAIYSAPIVPMEDGAAPPSAPPEATTSSQPQPQPEPVPNPVQLFNLRKPSLLTAGELRRLGMRHEEFARSLATRLSIHLRLEIGVQVLGLDCCYYPQLIDRLLNPTQVALFKVESLDGVGLLEIPPKLGIALVERLLGGAGKASALDRDLSEIEVALLDQVVDLMLKEWCQCVTSLPAAHPAIIGHETSPRFLQTASNDTSVLVLSLEFRLHDGAEKIQLALPSPMLQPVIRQLNPPLELKKQTAPTPLAPVKWNPGLDTVQIPLSVEWAGLEVDARKLAHLQVGDVLPVAPDLINHASVRLAQVPKFTGRLGKCGQVWAVELTERI